ncbi:hypothetical protein DXG01_005440 [Tephrocybe rancida]|nr:hypothetical protein DXG01_005440 [Tephrocybe rancida]
MSAIRADPAKAQAETVTKKPATTKAVKKKAAPKKAVKKVVTKKKAVKKKAVKKDDGKLTIPRGTKIPPYGPSGYIYFMSRIMQAPAPRTKETFTENSKAASAAWRALSDAEKQASCQLAPS